MVLRSILLRQFTNVNVHSHFRLSACVSSFQFSTLSETSFRRRFSSTPVVRAAASASRSRRQRQAKFPPRPDLQSDVVEPEEGIESESESESEKEMSKSRSQLKREARRSVRWGMDLASFTVPQIKRILSVASLENDVYDAITVVKKLGPDVREGKRRQYNYIGKLLRSADPELLDTLIRATKDGDHSTLKALSVLNTALEDSDGDFEESESDDEVEEHHIDMATRWLEGLIGKDADITKEIYSLRDVDFDRQELRKLVRRVTSSQEALEKAAEDNKKDTEAVIMRATKSLTRFLRKLAKQLPYDI